MENVVLFFCIAGLTSILFGRALERIAKFIQQMVAAVGHVTELFAAVAVILVLISPLGIGHKRAVDAMKDVTHFVRQMTAAVHVPGR